DARLPSMWRLRPPSSTLCPYTTIFRSAGTRRRGKDEAEDQRLEREMLASEKERAEHIMLVDLGRNDLGRVCEYGTVKAEKLLTRSEEHTSELQSLAYLVCRLLREKKQQ